MIRRSTFLAALMLLPLTAAAPASHAFAQEAIMLETIGAVRMLPPHEVDRMKDDATTRQPPHEIARTKAPQRSSAAVVD